MQNMKAKSGRPRGPRPSGPLREQIISEYLDGVSRKDLSKRHGLTPFVIRQTLVGVRRGGRNFNTGRTPKQIPELLRDAIVRGDAEGRPIGELVNESGLRYELVARVLDDAGARQFERVFTTAELTEILRAKIDECAPPEELGKWYGRALTSALKNDYPEDGDGTSKGTASTPQALRLRLERTALSILQ
jgi:hypothetical protein